MGINCFDVRYKMGQEGIRINSSMTREIGNAAKETNITAAELKEFLRGMITDMLGDALKETRITVLDKK